MMPDARFAQPPVEREVPRALALFERMVAALEALAVKKPKPLRKPKPPKKPAPKKPRK